jgi:type IV fimbrial biogenesis protein FimT
VLRNANTQQGFTLVELLTTITVIGLSLSLAVPGFNAVVNSNRRATGINQLVSTMYLARSEAITRNSRVTVCPSTTGVSCQGGPWQDGWMLFADTNGNQAIDLGEQVLGSLPAAARLKISSNEFPTAFSYRPNGRIMGANPAQNNGQITVCDPRGAQHARVIIVNASGHPHLSNYLVGGGAPSCP